MQPDDRGSAATSKAQSTAGWRRIGSTRPLRFLVALPARPEATALEAALSRSDSPGHESCGRDGFTADCVNLPAYCCSVMGVAVRGPRPATHTVLGRERLTEIGAARVCRHSTGSGCLNRRTAKTVTDRSQAAHTSHCVLVGFNLRVGESAHTVVCSARTLFAG
jgi:hypothetical protein